MYTSHTVGNVRSRMAQKKTKAVAAPRRQTRLTIKIDESIAIKAAQSAKARRVKLGDVVQEALEAHLAGCYWVDSRGAKPAVSLAGVDVDDQSAA